MVRITKTSEKPRTWWLKQGQRTKPFGIHRGYDWHGASIKNVMSAIQSLATALPGVPDSLKGLSGIRPDPERLFMAGKTIAGCIFGWGYPDLVHRRANIQLFLFVAIRS